MTFKIPAPGSSFKGNLVFEFDVQSSSWEAKAIWLFNFLCSAPWQSYLISQQKFWKPVLIWYICLTSSNSRLFPLSMIPIVLKSPFWQLCVCFLPNFHHLKPIYSSHLFGRNNWEGCYIKYNMPFGSVVRSIKGYIIWGCFVWYSVLIDASGNFFERIASD